MPSQSDLIYIGLIYWRLVSFGQHCIMCPVFIEFFSELIKSCIILVFLDSLSRPFFHVVYERCWQTSENPTAVLRKKRGWKLWNSQDFLIKRAWLFDQLVSELFFPKESLFVRLIPKKLQKCYNNCVKYVSRMSKMYLVNVYLFRLN